MELDEIIEGLFICSQEQTCNGCPYEGKDGCAAMMKNNAIAAIKELRAKAEANTKTKAVHAKEVNMIDAQAQAIEELHAINARLEGKVEAYEHMLRLVIA